MLKKNNIFNPLFRITGSGHLEINLLLASSNLSVSKILLTPPPSASQLAAAAATSIPKKRTAGC